MTQKKDAHIPPASVKANAKKGLELHHEFHKGGTEIGVNRAHQLSKGEAIDEDTIIRMSSYFARHEVDKKAEDFGKDEKPSKGYIAWLLWGGDAGKEWADKLKSTFSE